MKIDISKFVVGFAHCDAVILLCCSAYVGAGGLLESGTKGGIWDWTTVRAKLSSVSRTPQVVSIYSLLTHAYSLCAHELPAVWQFVEPESKRNTGQGVELKISRS